MKRQWKRWTRRFVSVASAAVLLQAGSCSIDQQQIVAGLANSIIGTVVQNFVFSSFNLIP